MTTPAGPAVWNPQNVAIGFGYLFLAEGGTPMEPMTTPYGTQWAEPWLYAGATAEGITVGGNKSTQDITIEEQAIPVMTVVTSIDLTVSADLMEDTMQSLLYAFGAGELAVAAATTEQGAITTLNLNDVMNDYAVGVDVSTRAGRLRRFYIPNSFSTADMSVQFRRAEAARQYSVELHAQCRPDQIVIKEITSDPTA